MKVSALGTNHWKYRHLALFFDKHVVRTNHKHTLVFLKYVVYEYKIYRSHEFSARSSNISP